MERSYVGSSTQSSGPAWNGNMKDPPNGSSKEKMKFQPVNQEGNTASNEATKDYLDEAPPYSSTIPAAVFVFTMLAAFIIPAILMTRKGNVQIFLEKDNLILGELDHDGNSVQGGGGGGGTTDDLYIEEDSADLEFVITVGFLIIGPILFFIQWALASIGQSIYYVFDKASYVHDHQQQQRGRARVKWYALMIPTRTILMCHLCILSAFMRFTVGQTMTPVVQQLFLGYCEFGVAVFMFLGWTFALEDGHHLLYQYAASIDQFVSQNKKSQKWLNIMKEVGSFQNPQVDKAYQNAGYAKSPAYALAGAAGMFVIIFKFLGLTLLLCYMVGLDLYKNIFIIGLTAAVALATNAASINSTIGTLASLTMSNAIHAGELIALSNAGSAPGHNPSEGVVGFVEGFTWSYIVIRDFKKMQVFVPYQELQSLTLHNWSRRPTKLVSIELSVQPSLSGGAARLAKLCAFVKEWMQRHPDLDQDGYTKSVIKLSNDTDNNASPTLIVMFYNRIGHDKNKLRNEFVVMLMDAAQKLDLCLTPAEQRPKTNWPPQQSTPSASSGQGNTNSFVDDDDSDIQRHLFTLMPSDELTARSGFGNKFKDV